MAERDIVAKILAAADNDPDETIRDTLRTTAKLLGSLYDRLNNEIEGRKNDNDFKDSMIWETRVSQLHVDLVAAEKKLRKVRDAVQLWEAHAKSEGQVMGHAYRTCGRDIAEALK